MKSGREELRRGVREILEGASQDLESLMSTPVPPPEERRPHTAATEARPVLRLVRDPAPHVPAATVPPPIPEAVLPEMPAALPKKGVCQAYFINKRCWELPEAFCNTALQVCMTRECPIYHLYKEEMERRFAAKFAHFW
ncbi:MAG: hypothetical protein XU14_C0059G0011 [Armatimonadetes bacterium CSP1-3]|nr:MAG: hypothetical protein XU14_C0059G0011 [Armatimonadetes bacterium CSP1-3]